MNCSKNRLHDLNLWEAPKIKTLDVTVNPIDEIDIRGIDKILRLLIDPCVNVKHRHDQKVT